MTPAQCRMARAALLISRQTLADLAGLSPTTITRYELGGNATPDAVKAMRDAMEAEGVRFFYQHNGGFVEGVVPPKGRAT